MAVRGRRLLDWPAFDQRLTGIVVEQTQLSDNAFAAWKTSEEDEFTRLGTMKMILMQASRLRRGGGGCFGPFYQGLSDQSQRI